MSNAPSARGRHSLSSLLPILLLCGGLIEGCSGDDDGIGVALMCDSGDAPLTVGRCRRPDGTDCNGCEAGGSFVGLPNCAMDMGGAGNFVRLGGGDAMPVVLGPQGSPMLVLGAQAAGIENGGSEAEWPRVGVGVVDRGSGEQLADFTDLHVDFDSASGTPTANLLFVVLDSQNPSNLVGHSLGIVGSARDRGSMRFCGRTNITVDRYIE